VAGLAEFVPAVQVAVAVKGDVFGQGVEGEVGGDEGEVVEEGPVAVFGGVFLQAVNGVVGGGGGGVVAGFVFRDDDGDVVNGVAFGGEEVALVAGVQGAVKAGFQDGAVNVP